MYRRCRRPLQAEGHEIRDEDIACPPLKYRNLNLLGRYSFTASTPATGSFCEWLGPESRPHPSNGDLTGLPGLPQDHIDV